jgi:hypothetical protein
MKKFLFSMVIILIIPVASIAQDVKNRIHEAGISFSSFNSFGVRYKTGTEKTLFRLTLLSVITIPNEIILPMRITAHLDWVLILVLKKENL